MADDKPDVPGTATPPPVVGQGCVQRFDPEALSDEDGTEFEGAEALWQRMQREQQSCDK
ncbi:hypothetical protein Pstr01_34830 [Pseudomonas straminea]|uniref:Uncharacterized protein n=1 Tax=Pseudomonas straminea TaxID=47882 RepID=A0A1I1XEF4_PSEOC|nr:MULTISPECIES: hypothetical protein [Pseudomonas]TWE05457.1 hypothetical protein FB481_107204 [Pseudomonas sp. AG1028]GLX15244.1 hypothetical protein Pstr01_34830 [Pseudomonas straminea]SFE03760.1 hypothetical protein SAMN05216372_107107 [Pseudomonas straminea]